MRKGVLVNPYKRPEKETDPNKLPGQIVNRPQLPSNMRAAIVKVLGNCSDMDCAEKAYIAEQVVAELADDRGVPQVPAHLSNTLAKEIEEYKKQEEKK